MQDGERISLAQIQAFLEGSEDLRFKSGTRTERCAWVERMLVGQEYSGLSRAGKGLVRRYLAKMTGLSRAQVTRLIGQYRDSGQVKARVYRRHRFAARYKPEDIALLAAVDEAHETLSGPATQKILQREYYDFRTPVLPIWREFRWRMCIACERAGSIDSTV